MKENEAKSPDPSKPSIAIPGPSTSGPALTLFSITQGGVSTHPGGVYITQRVYSEISNHNRQLRNGYYPTKVIYS